MQEPVSLSKFIACLENFTSFTTYTRPNQGNLGNCLNKSQGLTRINLSVASDSIGINKSLEASSELVSSIIGWWNFQRWYVMENRWDRTSACLLETKKLHGFLNYMAFEGFS